MQPIKTALCSFGMSGRLFHAPFIETLSYFELYAVWERSKKLAAEKYPSIISYDNYEDLLADDAIELVIVNTPNATHFEYAKKALLAGKHVIVEKPFTVHSDQAKELQTLAEEQSRKLAVYHNRRFDSDFKTVKKVIDEGYLGKIVEAEIHFDRYKQELSPKTHKEMPGDGTGALYDLGSHLIDQALTLFGLPEAVFGDIRIIREISKVDDYFEVLLYYPELRVRLKSSYLVREALAAYSLHGTLGSFVKSRGDVQEANLDKKILPNTADWGVEPDTEKGLLHTEKNGTVVRDYIDTLLGNYNDYFRQVYEAIRLDKPVPVSAEDGLNVIRVIEAAFESSEGKKVVKF
ncbi:Gfo/Idh/MocA family oxidoreductase [Pinibacter soli]|uniref:Gfo/Idh/MocA family oxidoreductase n=1 Tax=Pinibacter soli TaxID=3044211 RepID=A0ABT6R964_9BACT|nr:Gfo/Idh/MocA family oxidoreductase [Pinibacter soli]MDI3319087.1 Gfo/Idh/MocA family oxidoreductase [Pinibacter soli]